MASPAGGSTRYSHSQIRDVARKVRGELDRLSGAGSLPDLTSRGRIAAAAFGNWDAARTLSRAVSQGNGQIVRVYQQYLDDLRAAVTALEKTADNYRQADETMLENVRAVGDLLDRPPSTEPTPTRSTVTPME